MASNEQWDIVSGVGITALMVAVARATESRRDDALVHDPYAAVLAEASGAPQVAAAEQHANWDDTTQYIGLRSRYFDDFFRRAADEGARQAVVLASGLDTRAFRLDWPEGFRVFEIDQPKVLEFKDTALADRGVQPRCERTAVPVDLREDWPAALRSAGFDPGAPTAWLAEGLMPYLPAAAVLRLLEAVDELSAPGSAFAVENITATRPTLLADELSETSREWGVDINSLFSEDDRPAVADRLGALGWKVHQTPVPDVAAHYGRTLGPIAERLSAVGNMLIAQRPH
ncbi:SAM-dependent methyltransferase [Saccharopolyspora rosea]|uniref:S-adenosyl-L-methionine-dependent methyltransferase n=1 Tax=Saccharopolyspora rosea TaxID=524884 RepID=A0ABW3G285_9PSEU|nr:SAM-dependent methyltransferase [Saccharopolyspora rosea]